MWKKSSKISKILALPKSKFWSRQVSDHVYPFILQQQHGFWNHGQHRVRIAQWWYEFWHHQMKGFGTYCKPVFLKCKLCRRKGPTIGLGTLKTTQFITTQLYIQWELPTQVPSTKTTLKKDFFP